MNHIRQHALSLFVLASLLTLISCGADEEAVFEPDSDKAPRISIEKLSQEINDTGATATFKLVSDSEVKTDTVIRYHAVVRCGMPTEVPNDPDVYYYEGVGSGIILKGQKASEPITAECSLNERMAVWIVPIKVITVAGEGEMIDHEFLRGQTSREISNVVLPDGFLFPYYEIADTKTTLLYAPKRAKIVSIDPPLNTTFRKNHYGTEFYKITITFDTPPECPTVEEHVYDTLLSPRHASNVFVFNIKHYSRRGAYDQLLFV